jgi:tRNA nucleotidyltransferase (CCA-adding enzyme)
MVRDGEVNALQTERVIAEMQRALAEPNPECFFECLREVGALEILIPELNRLFGVPQPPQWHPEIDTGIHVLMSLQAATRLSPEPRVRFAALMHDLGKGLTPKEHWPKHIGHERSGAQLVESLCTRLRVPNDYKELSVMVAKWHTLCHQAQVLTPARVLQLLDEADVYRRFDRFEEFLLACSADFWGRTDFAGRPYPQADILRKAALVVKGIKVTDLSLEGVQGAAIGKALSHARLQALELTLATRESSDPN